MVKQCVFLVNKTGLNDKGLMAAIKEALGTEKTIKPATAPIFFTGNCQLGAVVETTKLTATVCVVESDIKPNALIKAKKTAAKNGVPFLVAKQLESGKWKIIDTSAPALTQNLN